MPEIPSRKLTGKVPADRIVMLALPRLPAALIEGYRALVDLTGTFMSPRW